VPHVVQPDAELCRILATQHTAQVAESIMTTYNQARELHDAAMDLVARHGGTVLQVRPRQDEQGWFVEVETARPLSPEIGRELHLGAVRVLVVDHGLSPLSERLGGYRSRPLL